MNKICNVGEFGIGEFKAQGKDRKMYDIWNKMIKRCYGNKNKDTSYNSTIISEEWLVYQNFAKWYQENYIEGFELDKDLLGNNSKIYSSETCCFLPKQINSALIKNNYPYLGLFRGVKPHFKRFRADICMNHKKVYIGVYDTPKEAHLAYKEAKEKYIQELGEKWKHLLSEKVYSFLKSYKYKE